jgi:hypothetical protein
LPRAGWATEAHGPLECYRDFRQKYARATSQPFRRAAGVFATSTRATGARLKLCQAQAVGRFPAESYSLPIPSFPLQPLRPHNARTRARDRSRLVALSPSGDLLIYAKDLFGEANYGPLAPLHCWLICSCGLPDPAGPFLGQHTRNRRSICGFCATASQRCDGRGRRVLPEPA